MRIAWPGAARNPEKFTECAKRMIRFNVPTNGPSRNAEDAASRVDLIKSSPPKRNIKIGNEQPDSYRNILKVLVADFLNLLVEPWEPESKKVPELKKDVPKEGAAQSAGSERTSRSTSQYLSQLLMQSYEATGSSGSTGADVEQTAWKNSEKAKRPIMSKSVIMRMLAELVKSYNHVAEFVMRHTFATDQTPLVKEVCENLR